MAPPPIPAAHLLIPRAVYLGPNGRMNTTASQNNCDQTCKIILPSVIIPTLLLAFLFIGYAHWRPHARGLKNSADQAPPATEMFKKLRYRDMVRGWFSKEGKDREGANVAGSEMNTRIEGRKLGSLRKDPRRSGYVDMEQGVLVVEGAKEVKEAKS